jgi:hypothetical protein
MDKFHRRVRKGKIPSEEKNAGDSQQDRPLSHIPCEPFNRKLSLFSIFDFRFVI